MRKKCRFAGLFLAGFSVFAITGCGNNGFKVTLMSQQRKDLFLLAGMKMQI